MCRRDPGGEQAVALTLCWIVRGSGRLPRTGPPCLPRYRSSRGAKRGTFASSPSSRRFKEFATGDVVIQAGDPSDAFYLVIGGRARVLGKPRACLLRRGDSFGEMGLIDGQPRSASILAAGELQTMALPRRPFLRLLEQEPGIAVAMLAELAARVRALEKSPVA